MDTFICLVLASVIAIQVQSIYLEKKAPNILPEEIKLARKEGKVFILDVRSKKHFNKFHIKGSTNIPLPELKARLDELPNDRKIILVSPNGMQTGRTTLKLMKKGFDDVVNLKGGINDWKRFAN